MSTKQDIAMFVIIYIVRVIRRDYTNRRNLSRTREPDFMRVLVVEDDAKIASFVSKELKQAGFSVDTTSDGQNGLGLSFNRAVRRSRHPYYAT
jgi:CTP:molybdopterin cytidylyltransferase MocA